MSPDDYTYGPDDERELLSSIAHDAGLSVAELERRLESTRESEATTSEEWRVGHKQPRNIYHLDRLVAVAVGDDESAARVAQAIAASMNERAQRPGSDG